MSDILLDLHRLQVYEKEKNVDSSSQLVLY